MVSRFELRSPPLVFLACLLGSAAGLIVTFIAAQAIGQLQHGQSVLDLYLNYQQGGPMGALWAQVIWSLFLLPFPLAMEMLVGLPVVWFVVRRRPSWLQPPLICIFGLLVGAVGASAAAAFMASSLNVTPRFSPATAALGAGVGLVAALVFRVLAIRVQQLPSLPPTGAR